MINNYFRNEKLTQVNSIYTQEFLVVIIETLDVFFNVVTR